jgi:hypothetical protein
MGRPKLSENPTHISLVIEQIDLVFLDKICRKLNMSRAKYIAQVIRNPNIDRLMELEAQVKALQAEIDKLKANTPNRTIYRLKI